ncbi:MAG: LptF/LptG family permease [Candidatus Omnitrophica bacterium]|nr:LptF/LptG family permease [Candidatus Omnitrophota bacterium]
MRILRNYVLKEFLSQWLMTLSLFTFILVVGNLIKLADLLLNKGVAPIYVAQLFVQQLPFLLRYSIPMSLLAGTLLAFGRLASDNEIVAMRASGFLLYKLALPMIVVGLIFSLFCMILNDHIIPQSHFSSRRLLKELGLRNPTAMLEPGTFIRSFKGYIVFISAIEGDTLRNVRIYQPRPTGPARTIIADRGQFVLYPDQNLIQLQLLDGTTDEPNPKQAGRFYKMYFRKSSLTLDYSDVAADSRIEKKPKDMTIRELQLNSRILESEGIPPTPLEIEIHTRVAFSFASLAFVLVALPLALWAKRGERSVGLGLSLLVLVLYYLGLAGMSAVAMKEIFPVAPLIWAPNMVLAGTGILFLFRTIEQ